MWRRRDSICMGSSVDLSLTRHCVERFHERFRPALDHVRARAELELLIEHGELSEQPPEWMARTMRQEADAYLIVGNDLVIPLVQGGPLGEELVAKTCIPRGGISDPARRRRNERARHRRARRHARRRR
jgi:hypothetical protein